MSESESSRAVRALGFDKRVPELPTFSVPVTPQLGAFFRDVFNKELAIETSKGNIPLEGDQESILTYVQKEFGKANLGEEFTVDLNYEDLVYISSVYHTHKKELLLPEIPNGLSPELEMSVRFQGAKALAEKFKKPLQNNQKE